MEKWIQETTNIPPEMRKEKKQRGSMINKKTNKKNKVEKKEL